MTDNDNYKNYFMYLLVEKYYKDNSF